MFLMTFLFYTKDCQKNPGCFRNPKNVPQLGNPDCPTAITTRASGAQGKTGEVRTVRDSPWAVPAVSDENDARNTHCLEVS